MLDVDCDVHRDVDCVFWGRLLVKQRLNRDLGGLLDFWMLDVFRDDYRDVDRDVSYDV